MKIGFRTIKTAIAVFLCFLVDESRESGVPFYAAIAAILGIQKNTSDSIKEAKNREIATVTGGVMGGSFLLFERLVYQIQTELMRYFILSLMLIPIIQLSVKLNQKKGTFLMCVVFLCVTVTHKSDSNPLTFALARIIDTTIGLAIALCVNYILPYDEQSEEMQDRIL